MIWLGFLLCLIPSLFATSSEGHVKECSGSKSLSRYELNVDLLHVHADKSTFH
ncbi:hypothetical protein ACJW30_03G165700 [Castanea mollissima]